MAAPKPDYLSRDYTALRQSLLDYASVAFPDWQPSSEGDFGMVMVELFAYVGDILSHYTDRAQMENYLPTATQRESVLGLAYLLGYIPSSGSPASGTVTFVTDSNIPDTVVPAGTRVTTGRVAALDGPVAFEVDYNPLTPDGSWSVYGFSESTPAVPVTEGTSVERVLIGESTGQPGQSLLLPHVGVYADTLEVFVEDNTWVRQSHLLDADSDDEVYETVLTGDNLFVTFGDDINGAIPPTGLSVYASYRHGVGIQGNVAVGSVRIIDDRQVAGVHIATGENGVYLSGPMVGGADPESTESIRYNAPRAYRTQDRAVTVKDYLDLALGTENVSKANVVVGTFTSVTIYVTGADGGLPSDVLVKAVQDRMEGRTLAGVTVTVAAPTFVPVNFGSFTDFIEIETHPQYATKTVRAEAERQIRTYVNGLAFGDRLTVGAVYDLLTQVEGVKYANIPVVARDDSAQVGTLPITPRPWEVFTVGSIYLSISGGTV